MLGTSTRISSALRNLGLRPLGWLAEAGSPQFAGGALYETHERISIAGAALLVIRH